MSKREQESENEYQTSERGWETMGEMTEGESVDVKEGKEMRERERERNLQWNTYLNI